LELSPTQTYMRAVFVLPLPGDSIGMGVSSVATTCDSSTRRTIRSCSSLSGYVTASRRPVRPEALSRQPPDSSSRRPDRLQPPFVHDATSSPAPPSAAPVAAVHGSLSPLSSGLPAIPRYTPSPPPQSQRRSTTAHTVVLLFGLTPVALPPISSTACTPGVPTPCRVSGCIETSKSVPTGHHPSRGPVPQRPQRKCGRLEGARGSFGGGRG